ncbi:LysR family transcriptional regulator [Vibrio sp. TH_r3]|uniref:LysR family transcriptional regulator n=1 Tax=Vibrio sp. TH_r3 TaxID=3082084 RepID=UPI0029549D23|nr:LysR family transcriptional regulator [Vibrio sp. TH_r3]MDV7103772.1 LysR family transcriptional regulator [Vibrio sp. TH_r3]
MNIEHLKLFIRIAASNNISQAGQELGLSPAVASAHVNKLEESLGVRLIHRTTRKVSLTEEGIDFLPHAEEVLATVDAARASVGAGKLLPQGTLRITAPASFGRMHLLPALREFLLAHPTLSIDLRLSDAIVDLVEGGFDVALRNAELKDSSLIAKKIASDNRIICASPDYLANFGEPKTPQDLLQHQCINLRGLDHWLFKTPTGEINIKTKGHFRTDHGEAVRDACVQGIGVAMNAKWSVYKHLQSGELIQILKDYPLISHSAIWAVYPSSRLLAPKVRAFIDYFADYYGDPPYWNTTV